MAKVKFKVTCVAQYDSELELPEDIDIKDRDELLDWVRNNLVDASIIPNTMEWVNDFDNTETAVGEYDLKEIVRDNGEVELL